MATTSASFATSTIIVQHNAIKNVIFRIATFTLDFFILRIFGLIAFQLSDYTSFLMFAEDLFQKAWFVSSRGITARQSLLVAMFALVAAAGELYDTMLWAIDNPGFTTTHVLVNGATLANQISDNPTYVVKVNADAAHPNTTNNLNNTFTTGLYSQGLNFSLPGIYQPGTVEVAPSRPINYGDADDVAAASPRIRLDEEGFAVGPNYSFMDTPNMLQSNKTACVLGPVANDTADLAWNCNVPSGESLTMLNIQQGIVEIWWDQYHPDFLTPLDDNPWSTFCRGGGTLAMKEVFTVTKGRKRHTFLTQVAKAGMSASSTKLDDGQIFEFIRKTWGDGGSITPSLQVLIDDVIYAKGNNTGRTFGVIRQVNDMSVLVISSDYLTIVDVVSGEYLAGVLRFIEVNTTLIRSETLEAALVPSGDCQGAVFRDTAIGGVRLSSVCNLLGGLNQTLPIDGNPYLGQMDTSTVAMFEGYLGDGSSDNSSLALWDTGITWLNEQEDHAVNLLISRAMLLGGNSSAVMVEIERNVVAISGLQLFLCILPGVLALGAWLLTRREGIMTYYQSSFLAAVLATTHTTAMHCENLGYVHSMPEISPQRRGRHITLGTPNDGTISNTVSIPADEQQLVYEPLILTELKNRNEDREREDTH